MSAERLLSIQHFRRLAWHLRKGGIAQARTYIHRSRLGLNDALMPTAVSRSQNVPARSGLAGRSESATLAGYTLDFLPAQPSRKKPMFPDLTVATILDKFSQTAWSHEFPTLPVTPESWHRQLEETPPDLLLVESAWSGNDGAWQYQLTGSNAPSAALRELVAHCREVGVPSVFWNKEDPPHFEDFLDTARLFDVVLTSDSRLIPEYQRKLGHESVFPLSFAAQPAVHNPIRPQHGFHQRDVAFAGMYFSHKFRERREQMQLLLNAALAVSGRMKYGLEIFSRFVGDDERYQFPAPFSERVVGGLDYDRMLTAYKAFKVFLNVNSVTESPSMCARRLFEITASGTPVITTASEAIPRFFTPEQVPVVDSAQNAQHTIRALVRSPELNDRTAHLGQREIWRKHTYAHRMVQVLEAAGLFQDAQQESFRSRLSLPSVSAVVSTNRPHQLDHVLEALGGLEDVDLEVVLVTHGFEVKDSVLRTRAAAAGIEHLETLDAPQSWSLGRCLNEAAAAASGKIMTKIDDDDLYGPQYLADLLRTLRFSGADIVGKQAHYMHLLGRDATMLRFPDREHRWTDFVMGPTMTGRTELFRDLGFSELSRGEDSDFLKRAVRAGASVYSSDRFNFCQMRQEVASGHAWDVEDVELLATGEVKFFGLPLEHLFA
ncbi:glycosyltransferase [Kocuria sp. TGY1127_2]|uniref:glycosyltransferase family protein n=1 Tax=Kocuria sp. TGY1127_2 TaxID=2711328 RepID=UPI0015BAD54E|nr:glycosyltransferase [Kocuria sp. TGY1127_2]